MKKNNEHIDFNFLTRYLADELNSEEKKLVTDWLGASAENRKEFDNLKDAWNAVSRTNKDKEIDLEKEWKLHQRKKQSHSKPVRSIPFRSFVRIAAAIIIGVGLVLAGLKYNTQIAEKTKFAETRDVVLPDGSTVTLNAGSKISYNKNEFGVQDRILRLRGEAYFVVAKDRDRPFIIQLDEAEIKVLGTSFNVKAYGKQKVIELTVSEGKVSFYDKTATQKQVIAIKGEKAEFNKQLKVIKKFPNTDRNYKSWKTGDIVFQNDSLVNVINTLNHVYHKNIILQNTDLNACTITASFEKEDFTTVLKILKSTLDLEIREEKNEIIISGEGC